MKTIIGIMVLLLIGGLATSSRVAQGGTDIYPSRCMMRVTYATSRGLPEVCRAVTGGFAFCRKRAEANVWEVATPLWCQE